MVKSQYKQDLHYSSYKEKTATKLCWHVLKTLLFQYIPYFKTHLHLACLSSILKLTIQNTMKDHQTCNPVSSSVILSPGYHWYCGSFLWKWMRNNPSLDTSFLFSTKNPNDPDFFYLILHFSKEMHPKCGNIRKVANMFLIFLTPFYVFCGLHV